MPESQCIGGRRLNRSSITQILEQVLDFLQVDGPILLAQEERASFSEKAAELLENALKPGEVLYVGILGGTGVGKSTLINALARNEISLASDRRPFTDKAVVYRHRNTSRGLHEIAGFVREPDALHDSDAIKDLVLLDLPDFDSVEHENRKTVLEILPSLDAAVWVVSPEKYADAAFYEFARQASINPDNFTFVLNKADELITDDGFDPHVRLKDVLGDLTFRLKYETGLDQPRIFSLSAAYEFHGGTGHPILENEFRGFRDFLMVRRDAKEIASVKTANLVERTRLLLRDLNEAAQPEDKAGIVANIRRIEDVESELGDSANMLLVEQEQLLASAVLSVLMAEDRSINPVATALKFVGYARAEGSPCAPGGLERTFRGIGETFVKHWSADLYRVTGRTESELLLTFRRTEAGLGEASAEDLMKDALSRALATFDAKLTKIRQSMSGTWSVWRRLAQKLALWFPVAILTIRLTGERAVASFLDHPDLSNALKLVLSFLTSIFSSDGLIGLVALVICELFIIWYIAAARIKKIRKSSRGLARFGIDQLNKGLASAARKVRSERRDLLRNIEQGLNRLTALNDGLQPSGPGKALGGPTGSPHMD
jgi:GTP-binding protein EngB required for normal cell division